MTLALDATSLGDRFTILSISVVYRGRAIPVAWKVLHANVPHPWKLEWVALLRVFAGLVPPGWTVIVMTDRALYARWLYQEIVALGWHPVIPITHQSKFRKGRSKKSVPVTALVPGLWDDPPLGTHGYGVSMVRLVIQIVGTGVALQAVPRVLQSTAAEWG